MFLCGMRGVKPNTPEKLSMLRCRAHGWMERVNINMHRDAKDKRIYGWLRRKMGMTHEQCHIGLMTEAQCEGVILLCKHELKRAER